jgi:hypothetical protein
LRVTAAVIVLAALLLPGAAPRAEMAPPWKTIEPPPPPGFPPPSGTYRDPSAGPRLDLTVKPRAGKAHKKKPRKKRR